MTAAFERPVSVGPNTLLVGLQSLLPNPGTGLEWETRKR